MDITRSVISERDRALLGGDYKTYHAQAARRIHALRRRLGTATPRGRKFIARGPITAEMVAQNAEWVQLLLASSERSWASAMAMKSSQSSETTQKAMAASTKRQIASRLRRATTYAENLVEVLKDRSKTKASGIDLLEAKAYLALMRGGLDFEQSRWRQCLRHYSTVRIIYVTLGSSSKNDIYKDLLSSLIDPSIRYAAYQSKLPRTKPVPEITIDSFPTSDSETATEIQKLDAQAFQPPSARAATDKEGIRDVPSTLSWRSRTVKIEDAAIAQAIGVAQEREKALASSFDAYQKKAISSRDLAAVYDEVITARQDAVDATKTALEELAAEGVEAGDPRMQALQVTRTAVNYAVVEWRIGRNRVLCGDQDGLNFEADPQRTPKRGKGDDRPDVSTQESSGPRLARLRERVALYDSILQSVDAVKDLPGVMADSDFVAELDSRRRYFRSLKCVAIGRSQAINGAKANALALYARALDLVRNMAATSARSTGAQLTKFQVTMTDVEALSIHVASLVTQHRALAELKNIQKPATTPTQSKSAAYQTPLVERLHLEQYEDHPDLSNLVSYPPRVQPVPVKPLFFDLAWNYIQYPGRAGEDGDGAVNGNATGSTQSAADTEQAARQPARKGWFGFGRG